MCPVLYAGRENWVTIWVKALQCGFDSIESFLETVPNETLCGDNELIRIGFNSPTEVEEYIALLEHHGLIFLQDKKTIDLVVVDQESGPTTPCDWIEFGRTKIDLDNADVASCRLINSRIVELITPQGWRYEDSLSQNLSIEHTDQTRKYLQFLRQEDGQEIYLNKMTGEEVAIDLP